MMEIQQSTVAYLEHALVPQKRVLKTFDRKTLNELAPQWERPFIALVNGKAVLRQDWDITIYEGHVVLFCDARCVPQGFFDSIFKAVLSVATIALAVSVPGMQIFAGTMFASGFGAALLSGAVMFAGMSIVNALLPPETNAVQNQQNQSVSPTYSLQAQGNYARLEQAIPEHFGRHIAYPDFAAQPYSEARDNEVYLHQLFCIGRGYYDIESIKIEDTPITNYKDVTYEIIEPNKPVNLFPSNVVSNEEVGWIKLVHTDWVGPFVANAEGTKAMFIAVDLLAPKGMFYMNNNGTLDGRSVTVYAEARPIDDDGVAIGDWQSLFPLRMKSGGVTEALGWNRDFAQAAENWFSKAFGGVLNLILGHLFYGESESVASETFSAATTTPQRYTRKFAVGYPGRYEVRMKRATVGEGDTHRGGDEMQWVGLKAYLEGDETYGDTTCLAVSMRSTNQLSGQASRRVNVIATRKLPIWNGSSWSDPTATKSIAWAAAYCCKQVGKTDSEIDLEALLSLDATWASRGDECNGRIDSFSNFWEWLTKICSAGRCKPYMQGGIVRFFRHQPQSIPVAMFSTRNIVSGSFSVDYLLPSPETADAIDISYFDEDFWKSRRVQAKLPDSSAEKPTKVDVSFITNKERAFAEGMYKAASNRLQRKLIRFTTEMEGFIPSFGDLIAIQHDMPAWGQSGELVDVEYHSNTITWSEDFSHSSWIKTFSGGGVAPVVTVNDAISPDGSFTADKVVLSPNGTLSTNISILRKTTANATVIGQPAIGAFWLQTTDGSSKQVSIGLTGPLINKTITVTGQWQRFSVSHPSATSTTASLQLRAIGNLNGGADVSLHVWGASMLKDSDVLPLYVPTTSSAAIDAPVLTTTEPLVFSETEATHYIALRDDIGGVNGPLLAAKSVHGDNMCILQPGSLSGFTPRISSDRERTHYTFGVADTWAQKAITMNVRPRGHYLVDIEAINEEEGIHTAEYGVTLPISVTSQLGNYVESPAVKNLIAVGMPSDHTVMLLSWEPAPWADKYIIEASANGSEWTRIGETSTASYTAKAIYGTSTIIRVAAVGLSVGEWNQISYDDLVTSTWDANLSGLTLTPNKGMLDISWDASSGWNLKGYEIRYGSSWESGTTIAAYLQSNTYSWQPVEDGTITIWVKAIDLYGVESIDAASATLRINEPVVSNLRQQVIDNNVLLSWTATQGTFAIDVAEIRRGLDFDTADVVGSIKGNFTVIFETESGSYKYWIVLRDIAGLYGQPVGVYAIVNQPPDYVIHDQQPLSLTGTPNNVVIENGSIYAPIDQTKSFNDHFDIFGYATPQEQIDDGHPYYLQPAASSGSYVETISYGATIPSAKVSLALSRNTIVGTVSISPTIETSPDGASWTTYSGVYECFATNFAYVRITLNLSTSDGGFEEITSSNVKVDIKVKKSQGTISAVSTDSGGTSVDITGQFVDVQSITLTPLGTSAAIAVYDFTDVPNPTSFKVLLFNTSGARISGTVSYIVQGV